MGKVFSTLVVLVVEVTVGAILVCWYAVLMLYIPLITNDVKTFKCACSTFSYLWRNGSFVFVVEFIIYYSTF